jgi:pyrroline-5-carboxylate reductase
MAPTLVGLVGAGPMATALARGWGRPVICTDAGSGRAALLAGEVGGRAAPGNRELAREAVFTVLCHPPEQLEAVAREVDGVASTVVSVLSGISLSRLRVVYRSTPVARFAVNLPVEVRMGTVSYLGAMGVDPEVEAEIVERFSELGSFRRRSEDDMPTVIGLSGVGPAYVSLLIEAQVEAARHRGFPETEATELVLQTMAGSVALLRRRTMDTGELRRSIASPGGPTSAGLGVLERSGVRAMFREALEAVVAVVEARASSPEDLP